MSAAAATLIENAEVWRPAVNPWIIAHHRHAGDFHGGARHLHRQRCPAAHRRQPLRRSGREHLGPDFLSRLQRHRASAERLALFHHGPQEFLHELRGAVHHQFFPVRTGAQPGHAHRLPRAARRWRRRTCSPASRPSSPTLFLPPNAAWPSRSTASPWSPRLPSALLSADGSPTTSPGAGFSSSTSRSASSPCC